MGTRVIVSELPAVVVHIEPGPAPNPIGFRPEALAKVG